MADITPINYDVAVANPFESAMRGYAQGAAVRDDQAALAARQQAAQVQQQQAQVLQSLLSNPAATADDYSKATLLVPGLKDHLKQSWDMRNTAQQQSLISDASQWYAAIRNRQPKTAIDSMNARADAMEQAAGGQTADSKALRIQAQVIEAHPEFGATNIGMMLAAHPEGQKVINSYAALGKEGRDAAEAPAELARKKAEATIKGVEAANKQKQIDSDLANTASLITDRSKRFGLEQDQLTTQTQLKLKELGLQYGQLPPAIAEGVNTAATESIAAEQSASRMSDLANKLEAEGGGFGALSTAGEWIKKATGNQNEMTRLRAEYNRIVTPAAMAAYKKVASGSTSDKDIDTAMTGVPKDTADAGQLAAFLRGAAKLQVYDSVYNDAKSQWLATNRDLGKAKADIEIADVKVPAGATFKNFADQFIAAKAAEKIGAMTVAGRGYMRFATPAAAAPAAPAADPNAGLIVGTD